MIRVAVVGVGSLGVHHARNYSRIPGVELVAVCDRVEERARATAGQLGTRFVLRPEELVGEVDAVSLVVPTVHHGELGEMFLGHGIHVLVEKPITATREEGLRLIAAAEKADRILQVGHLERFNPAVVAIRDRIHHPRFFEGHRMSVFQPRSLDVDVVLDLMIHDLDLVLSMVPSEIEEVHATGIPVLSPKIDIANARIQFRNGCVANLTCSRVSDEKIRKLRFFQPSDYISIDFIKRESEIVRLCAGSPGTLPRLERSKIGASDQEPLHQELCAFIAAVRKESENPCPGIDGLRALDAALLVRKEMRTA